MCCKIFSSVVLLVFEVVVCYGNFVCVVVEFVLMEGVISWQIVCLEVFFDSKFFDRMGSWVWFNLVGVCYVCQVCEIFVCLEWDIYDVSGMFVDGCSLEIVVFFIFVSCWLIFWFGCFVVQYLYIVVNIVVCSDFFILLGSGFDVVIYFEYLVWIGMEVMFLFVEYLLLVCYVVLLMDDDFLGLFNWLMCIYWW